MGRVNKRYEQTIQKRCPICDKRVRLGHRSLDWWIYCEAGHIPQKYFGSVYLAIRDWEGRDDYYG